MQLTASQEDFLPVFPPNGPQYSYLESLTLYIRPSRGLSWERLFDKAAQTFPNMDALTVDIPEDVDCPVLRSWDLGAFWPRYMTTLQLKYIPYHLTSQDLTTILKNRFFLRRPALSGDRTGFDPPTLVNISQLQYLEYSSLRIDCMSLIHTPPDLPSLPQKPLREIYLVSSTLKNAATLARNIRRIFPKLRTVDAEGAIVFDLQDAISALDFRR